MLAACTENPGAVPRQPDRQVSFDSEGAVPPEAPPGTGQDGTPYVQGPEAVELFWNDPSYVSKDRAVVQIRSPGGVRCTGTLVHRYFLLTAAHCF
ncbi:MAG: trypsin-like serine protease, partial [Polyangia bacterium]